jgi:putative YphP/YqiW family bacilliredoxin
LHIGIELGDIVADCGGIWLRGGNCVRTKLFDLILCFIITKIDLKMYPQEIVLPMKEELTDNGFNELLTSGDVEDQLKKTGTTLVMVNSVCGFSAGSARPGVLMAVANSSKRPDYLTTSFAGFDLEAVNSIRAHLLPYPPSSPAIALFKDGQLVHMIERHQIEGRPAQLIAHNLIAAFDEYC